MLGNSLWRQMVLINEESLYAMEFKLFGENGIETTEDEIVLAEEFYKTHKDDIMSKEQQKMFTSFFKDLEELKELDGDYF